MLDKLAAVSSRYEELCAKSEQPDFYDDPKRAAALLRERGVCVVGESRLEELLRELDIAE